MHITCLRDCPRWGVDILMKYSDPTFKKRRREREREDIPETKLLFTNFLVGKCPKIWDVFVLLNGQHVCKLFEIRRNCGHSIFKL